MRLLPLECRHATSGVGQFVIDVRRVQHVQHLPHRRLGDALALASGGSDRPAKQAQEIVRHFAVPQLNRPTAPRNAAKFLLRECGYAPSQ